MRPVPTLEAALGADAFSTWYQFGDWWPHALLDAYKLKGSDRVTYSFGVGRTGSGVPL